MGLTLDSFLSMQQKSKEEWREEIRGSVVDRLKRGLVLSKVVELEGLDASHSEILEQAKLIADLSRGGEQMWRNIIASPVQQNLVADEVRSSKAVELLAAIARGEAPEPGSDSEEEEVAAVDESDEDSAATESDQEADPADAETETETPSPDIAADEPSSDVVEEEAPAEETAEEED